MKPYPCIEKTIEINTVYYGMEMTLRLWINVEELNDGKQIERLRLAQEIKIGLDEEKYNFNFSLEQLANYLETKINGLNAFQLIEAHPQHGIKFGTAVYLVPFEDVHG